MAAMLALTPASFDHTTTSPARRIGRFLWPISIIRTISVVFGTFSIFSFLGLSRFNMEYRGEEERREARLAEVIDREQRDFARYYRKLRLDAAWEKNEIVNTAILEIMNNPRRAREIKDKALTDARAVIARFQPYLTHYRSLVNEAYRNEIHLQHYEMNQAAEAEQQGRCLVVAMTSLVFQYDEIVSNGGDAAAPMEIRWTADDLTRLRNTFPPPLKITISADTVIPPAHRRCYEQLEENKCPVCWLPYDQPTYLTGCLHVFCFRCIVESLTESAPCPLCREEKHYGNMDLLEVERIEEVKEDGEEEER